MLYEMRLERVFLEAAQEGMMRGATPQTKKGGGTATRAG